MIHPRILLNLPIMSLLRLLLLLAFAFGLAWASVFEPLPNMTHFVAEGVVHICPLRADLILDVDLHLVTLDIQATCRFITSTFNASGLPARPDMHTYLERACHSDLQQWLATVDLFTGFGQVPRFLGTLVASLFAGVTGLIFGEAMGNADANQALLDNQKHIYSKLRQTQLLAFADHKDLTRLAQLVAGTHRLQLLTNTEHEAAIVILALLYIQGHRVGQLKSALDSLLVHHRLHPGLLRADVLHTHLSALRSQAEARGLTLAVQSEVDLFSCPVSFITTTKSVVRLAVHIPVFDSSLTFTSLRYVPVPFGHSGAWHQVLLKPYVFGMTKKQDAYLLTDPSFWHSCTTFKTFKTCTDQSWVYMVSRPSCQLALYQSNSTAVASLCTIRTLPVFSTYWFLTHELLVVFHPSSLTLTVACHDKVVDRLHFMGSRLVRLDQGCVAFNLHFRISSAMAFVSESAVVRVAPPDFSGIDFAFRNDSSGFSEVAADLAGRVVHAPSFPPLEVPSPWWGRLGIVFGVLALLGLAALAYCLFRRSVALVFDPRFFWHTPLILPFFLFPGSGR